MKRNEILAAVTRVGLTLQDVSDEIGISRQSLSNKISGKNEFKASEIKAIALLLNLTGEQVNDIFFDTT